MGMFFERRCPYCRVIISDNANKCPHCGEWLISEKEKKQLDKAIQENKKFKEQVDGFIGLCIIIVFIVLAIFVAIDGIKNTFFSTPESNSVQENAIEQKGDVINMYEEDYSSIENQQQNQETKSVQQTVQSKPQQQPITQPKQQVSTETKTVVPQAKPVQTQQNQEINDFMY